MTEIRKIEITIVEKNKTSYTVICKDDKDPDNTFIIDCENPKTEKILEELGMWLMHARRESNK